MNKVTLYIGTGFDKAGACIGTTKRDKAWEEIQAYAVKLFGAYTVTETKGAWSGARGIVYECGIGLDIFIDCDADVARHSGRKLARFARNALNQQCVFLTVQSVNGEYV